MRMPIEDTLAGQVVRTGKPIRLDKARAGAALKVKTGFLVRAILQVPLTVGNTVIGVLAVDNQQSERTFSENDQYLLSALADYAAIAIDNARLYQEVKGSEERYRDLFANAYDLIFTLDRQLRILSINKVGSALTGYAEEQLRGRPLREIAAADAWDQAEPRFADLLMGRAIQPFELQLRRHDDERVLLEVSARLANDRGTARSIHCIARNLTERRRLEEQLIHSEKLSAIGQLVAGVAHELNNPLTSISGYTQLMLRDTGLRDDVRSDLKHINIQAERAARIVQNLLVFAREHKPERRMVNLNEEFRNTLSLRAYQLRVDNITVVNQIDPDLPMTVADPFQIQQVMLNLINNAHQAMTERGGPGTLTLRTFVTALPAADNGATTPPMVVLSVGDNGVGIPARDLKRIFDPFFTTKPVGQGTGLGLSICFGIVQEHGGRIWAESELEVGTTVYVALPLLNDIDVFDGEALIDGGAGEPEARLSCRVLVVDDEEPVANLLARLLRELGHQPTVVNGGSEALELIAREQFDLILSDVKMPGMSGFELHQTIRQTNPELAARLVFVTGDMLSAATQARIAQSGNPYIAKPFAIERLETLVRALLAQRPIEQQ
jgi:two-component system NtrC family sensor kinase